MPQRPSFRSLAWAALASALALTHPRVVLAQDAAPSTLDALTEPGEETSSIPELRAVLEEAVVEYDAAHYPEALALLRRAHELEPTARTLRGIGMAAFETRQYVLAVRALSEALSSTVRPLTGAQRADAEALLARALRFVARVRIELDPHDAALRVDGARVEPEPDGSLLLDPGPHALTAQHPARATRTLEVRIEPGARQDLVLTLEPIATPLRTPSPAPARSGDEWMLWVGAGLGVAATFAAAASAATGVIAMSDRDTLAAECDVYTCEGSLIATRDRARTLALTTDVVGSIGAALGVTSVVLLVMGLVAEPATLPEIAAGCTEEGCVGWVRGRF